MDELTTVYQYFAANGALIYVGITNRGTKRLHEHADSKPWWSLATGCTLEHFTSRDAALEREAYLIATFRPPYNYQHNPERNVPVAERASKRIGTVKPQVSRSRDLPQDEVKRRRREWFAATPAERLRMPCIVCAVRPGSGGKPMCLNCFEALEPARVSKADHRALHLTLFRGDTCPECGAVMRNRPPAQAG